MIMVLTVKVWQDWAMADKSLLGMDFDIKTHEGIFHLTGLFHDYCSYFFIYVARGGESWPQRLNKSGYSTFILWKKNNAYSARLHRWMMAEMIKSFTSNSCWKHNPWKRTAWNFTSVDLKLCPSPLPLSLITACSKSQLKGRAVFTMGPLGYMKVCVWPSSSCNLLHPLICLLSISTWGCFQGTQALHLKPSVSVRQKIKWITPKA